MPDRERGILRGPPLSVLSTTDSRWRRSSQQSSDGTGSPYEARHDWITAEPLWPADKTPAQRVHDSVGGVHDAGTGLAALAHAGASVRAMRAVKHQLRGLMVEPTGVHDERRASAIPWLTPMNRNAAIPSSCSPSPSVRRAPGEPTAAERRPECPTVPRLNRCGTAGHSPSPTWWWGHMACPQRQKADGIANAGSHCLRHGCVITASPPRAKREALQRAHRAHSPIALRSNHEPLMTLALGVHDSGSKIDVQYYWTWRPRRWPTPWACPRDGLGFAALGEKA
jgi:hypothetical protein